MRPEGTAGVVRSIIEHGLLKEQPIQKLWYCGPMFRYEKPQKGRLRQFNQIGVESFGVQNPAADAEIIIMCVRLLGKLGFKDICVDLNNLGDKDDRRRYNEELRRILQEDIAKGSQWCEQCRNRATVNPMRVFDCKEPGCRELLSTLPQISDFINDEAKQHFDTVTKILDQCQIKWSLNPDLVRGLDYYCRTVFEIVQTGTGAQSAVAGGGRYDGLIEELGGPATCGIGWAIGMERLIIAMKAQQLAPELQAPSQIHGFALDQTSLLYMFSIVEKLRADGKTIRFDLTPKSVKAGLKAASKGGNTLAIFAGENEVSNQQIVVKHLTSGEQETITPEDFFKSLC